MITSIIKFGMKLLIHFQTSMAPFVSAWADLRNLGKDKPAWGLGLNREQNSQLTDGKDDPSAWIREDLSAGWAFLAVDLETSFDIGYIRVLMSVCKYVTIRRTIL